MLRRDWEGESVETPGDPGLFHRCWTELKMSNKRDSVTIFSIFIFGLKYLSGPLINRLIQFHKLIRFREDIRVQSSKFAKMKNFAKLF